MGVKFIEKPTSINRELRIEILECALRLETNINTLILELLDISDKVKKRSLSGKSGSLPFKNKIDLLFDLEVINDDEYREFLLLMEFRNKFLHDLYCDSFENAFSLCGEQQNNTMLNLVYGVRASREFSKKQKDAKINEYNLRSKEEREQICIKSFYILSDRTVDIVKKKAELIENKYDRFIDIIKKYYKSCYYFKGRYLSAMQKLQGLCNESNAKEKIIQYLEEENRDFFSSEEAKKHIDTMSDISWISDITPKRRQEFQQD